jgi:hypothetical protein
MHQRELIEQDLGGLSRWNGYLAESAGKDNGYPEQESEERQRPHSPPDIEWPGVLPGN